MREAVLDRIERSEISLPIEFDRLPMQTAFFEEWEHQFRAYGGGFGNGKTSVGVALAYYLSVLFPDNQGFIGRWDGKDLRQTTMRDFFRLVPEQVIDKKNDQQGYIKFKRKYGGSEILYGDLREQPLSMNLGWFWFDQAEEVPEARWTDFIGRLRRKTILYGENGQPLKNIRDEDVVAPNYGLATFNPEGSHHWLWKWFHPDSDKRPANYKLYMASTYEGLAAQFVSQEYVDNMLHIYSEEQRKRYLEGCWDVFEGRIFPQFDETVHVVPRIELKPHWKLYETIDHGLQNPTAVGWWAVDEYDTYFLLDEHYIGGGKPVAFHAAAIKNKRTQFKHPIALTYLDSHCWAKDQSNGQKVYSIADEYIEHGIIPVPGQKDWDTAVTRIVQHLNVDPALKRPRLVVASHCTNFIKEMLGYRWKKLRGTVQRNAPDQPIDYNDHMIDGLCYLIASRPSGPDAMQPPKRNALELVHEKMRTYNPLMEPVGPRGTWMSS